MGLAQKKTIAFGSETHKRRTRPRAARVSDAAHHSPAAALQAHLEMAWTDEPVLEAKWSARRTMAFLVLANGAFWIGLGVMISRL